MTTTMLKGAAAVALAAVLAGCQVYGPAPSRAPFSPQPMPQSGSIEGEWQHTESPAIGRFAPGGNYEFIATDTGNRVSEGSYRRNERGVFELTGHSLLRNAPVRLDCSLASPSQLNCTSVDGQRSVLIRRQTMG